MGGSLNDRGGQNMLEPAAYGAAVLLGPNTRNFADVVAKLTGGRRRGRGDATPRRWPRRRSASSPNRPAASAIGGRAQRVLRENAGATAATADALVALLPAQTAAIASPVSPAVERTKTAAPGVTLLRAA